MRRRSRGFTLVEVLAALMLLAIALPAINRAIVTSQQAASTARGRTEASGLAEAKLNQIIAEQQWQGGTLSGDFGPDWPGYRWQASVAQWPQDTTNAGLQQVDLRVTWKSRGQDQVVTLSTLAYIRTTQ